ncbi:solute carrier family 22 member 21 [Pectinophora gossypiella]|uniref:solute carrier family 22 member 21 n=1 Tax=Pectinophora gossypiella TaxID=13191 RepID=UPI00214EBBCC|nr:solute carrier family 22 member 21 [Pectinophora gossypiella]
MESIYERALLEVGPNSLFQKKWDIIYNVIFAGLWCTSYMSIFLALVIPPHTCKLPEQTENISDNLWRSKYIPMSNDLNGQALLNSCMVYENPEQNNKTKECVEFVYDKTWYESTVPSENNWVCSKELYVVNIFAYSMIGEIIGSLLFGWFGDTYGRRLTYIIALALIVVGRTVSILAAQSYVLFTCGCIIASFPSWSAVQSVSVISVEISSPERRTTTATLRVAAMSFGVCVMSLLYWWIREWKLFFVITTVPLIPYLLFSWNTIESPRWLWQTGKSEECIRNLRQIAKINKSELETNTAEELSNTNIERNDKMPGPVALFSSRTLAVSTILQLLLWVFVTLSYRVLLISAGEKTDGNPFLEFALQAAVEMPGNVVGAWLADILGRRYSGMIVYGITASMWTMLSFHDHYKSAWIGNIWIGAVSRTICRMSTTSSYYLINLLNMELYPTCLRQLGMSIGNVSSSGASAIAPYVLYMGHRVDSRLPGLVLAAVSVIGILSSYILPETLNMKLPETVKDAQEFGNKRVKYSRDSLKYSAATEEIENLN